MAKSQMFKPPLQFIYTRRRVPVRRGRRDEEAFKTAHAILARGDLVVMYAEAGRSRSGELGKPRHGVGRLALESGSRWCRRPSPAASARNWKRLQFPKVTVQFGEPLRFERVEQPTRDQAQGASEIIFDQVRDMHGRLRSEGRRRVARAARSARRAARQLAAGRRLLVARLGVRHCHVVARDDQRVRGIALVELDLAQRAMEPVLVDRRVGSANAQRPQRVERVARHEHLAAAQAQDDRQMPRGMAGVDEPHAPSPNRSNARPKVANESASGPSKSSVRQSKAWSNWRGK